MKQKKALDFATAGFLAGPKAKGVRASFLPTHTQQKGLSPASRRGGCRSGLSPPGSPCHVLPAWLLLNSSKRLLATPWNRGPDFSLPFPTNTCFVGKQALGQGMEGVLRARGLHGNSLTRWSAPTATAQLVPRGRRVVRRCLRVFETLPHSEVTLTR